MRDFIDNLKQIFGVEALQLEQNPALANTHVTLCHAGNGLEVKKETGNINTASKKMNTKKMFMSLDTMPDESKEDFQELHQILKAFDSASIYGFGTKEIYGPDGASEYAASYEGLIDLLQIMHSVVMWTCDFRNVLKKDEEDKAAALENRRQVPW